jgi:hypothetical protein
MIFRLAGTISLLLTLAHAQSLPPPSPDEIVGRMEARNEQRALTQPRFECERNYTLDYHGFPESKHAEMDVRSLQDGVRKEFTILAESGSAALRSKVLHKMLDTEREASAGTLHEESRLIRKNYDFTLVDTVPSEEGVAYVFAIEPRVKSKVAWSGRVWVDAKDYAVVRAEGKPDKMPSWWTKDSHFISTYQKIEGTWLPKQNVSETEVRFGGRAHLVIDYKNCSSTTASATGERGSAMAP